MSESLWDLLDGWLEPVGGLPALTLAWIVVLTLIVGLALPLLLWRQLVWSKRGCRELSTLAAYVRRQEARKEKPEDAVARVLRERLRDVEIVTKKVAPSRPAAGKHSPLAPPPEEDPDPDAPLPMEGERTLPQWRAYGFDLQTGMRTSVILRATSVPHARKAAEQRGLDVTTVEPVDEAG